MTPWMVLTALVAAINLPSSRRCAAAVAGAC